MHRFTILFSIIFAIIAYYLNSKVILNIAELMSDIFIKFFQLISLPLFFLSITSSISGLENLAEMRNLIRKTVLYTLLITFIASSVALLLYLLIDPAERSFLNNITESISHDNNGYLTYLKSLIPSNFVRIFLENNMIGGIIVAFLMGSATASLSKQKREVLHNLFSALFEALLKIAQRLLKFIPIAIWSFITCFLYELENSSQFHNLLWYFICITSANFLQAFVILPSLMWVKGISPIHTFKGIFPALTVAFFSKSSTIALPTTINFMQNKLNVSKKVSSLMLPVCTILSI